jgi:hypothetical protein
MPDIQIDDFLDVAVQNVSGHPNLPSDIQIGGQIWMSDIFKFGCHAPKLFYDADPSLTIGKLKINFIALYPSDNSTSECALSLQNYNTLADHDSPPHTWLLIDPL